MAGRCARTGERAAAWARAAPILRGRCENPDRHPTGDALGARGKNRKGARRHWGRRRGGGDTRAHVAGAPVTPTVQSERAKTRLDRRWSGSRPRVSRASGRASGRQKLETDGIGWGNACYGGRPGGQAGAGRAPEPQPPLHLHIRRQATRPLAPPQFDHRQILPVAISDMPPRPLPLLAVGYSVSPPHGAASSDGASGRPAQHIRM